MIVMSDADHVVNSVAIIADNDDMPDNDDACLIMTMHATHSSAAPQPNKPQ